jgi:biopolymer transport protein ExbD
MRRFSQRSYLVTLSEINITPLLDLAFVLLIIFVITTPLLDKGMNLSLPRGGSTDVRYDPRNRKTVEIDARGNFMLNGRRMLPDQIEQELKRVFQTNPNLVVNIRADKDGRIEPFAEIINRCIRNGITKISFRTEADR